MTNRVDLHIHTTASDGQLSPTEIVRRALALGLRTIAITDHDTVDGVAEAIEAARGQDIEVVPGVEFSTDIPRAEVHVLGFFVDYEDGELRNKLTEMRESRFNRARTMVKRLERLGLPLEWDRIHSIAGEACLGRPHIARALMESGYVASVNEAFDRYIGRDRPAYVERFKLSPGEAVKLIRNARGLPVLAHPIDQTGLVPELVREGLLGIEVYYANYTRDEVLVLLEVAHRYGLVTTGGSDFHGRDVLPENHLGEVLVPSESVLALKRLHQRLSDSH
jgi:3',5'-nucleoside bisphosphate phosphatase